MNDYLELIRISDHKVLFTFHNYMDARSILFKMGFTDSVHKVEGIQRWQYNGKFFGLSHWKDGVQL